MAKHFLINPDRVDAPAAAPIFFSEKAAKIGATLEHPLLKHTYGRVIVSVDLDSKNSHRFADGTEIRYERQVDNFNRRQTEPVNAVVISADNIPLGSEILVHPNSIDETNRVTNYRQLSGQETGSDIKYYSIKPDQCFAWLNGSTWETLPPYETGLRVFKPYEGAIVGIEPTQLKDTLYCTSGEYKGQVLKTVMAADYVIIFQDINGREGQLLRWRPNGDEETGREPEAIAVLQKETQLVKEGKLLVGLEIKDAKKITDAN